MAAQNELSEALTAANLPALLQKVIDPLILEYQRRYSPLVTAISARQWIADSYYFNTRTQIPGGGFIGDGGGRPQTNSTYQQARFDMRHMMATGSVTGYSQMVTQALIGDLRRSEIEAAMAGLMWDLETALVYGNDPATNLGPWAQFSGLDSLVSQFSTTGTVAQNAIDWGGNAFSQGMLDQLIDIVEGNSAAPVGSQYMFVMSSTAVSREAQIQMALQRNVNVTEVAAGLQVESYRGIPMVKSSFLSSRALKMGTVAAAAAASGGSLPGGSYYYVIVPVMSRYGALSPSPEVTVATTGTTGMVNLSFTIPQGPEGGTPLLYQVYRGGSAGTETLLGYVDAVVGVQGDGVTPIYATGITDTGSNLVPTATAGATSPIATPPTYVGTSSRRPRVDAGEDLYLVPRDPDKLVRPWVRQFQPVEVYPTIQSPDQLPFALIADTTLALRGPKFVGRIRNVTTSLSS